MTFASGALLTALIACGDSETVPSQTVDGGDDVAEIAWFEGSIEEAFAMAKSEGRPMFLYWGAKWCPPCHYLQKRVFNQPDFVASLESFVPVYLDGDSERAQILGERLDVMGYPTVIIFDPLGEEVMRVASAVPPDQYREVLETTLATMRPLETVLEDVLATGPPQAPTSDLHLLAFYSWGQDSRVGLSLEDQREAFERLFTETPAELELVRSRFLGLYLQALTQLAQGEDTGVEIDDKERSNLRQAVVEVLESPELRNANLLWIHYFGGDIVGLLTPEASPERDELIEAWQSAADAMELDDTLTVDDRLTATLLKLELAKLDSVGGELPGELQAHARRQAAWAMETVTDESELQSVVNTLAYLLESAGLADEAESMLLAKMNDTVAPYYFMSWIASLKADAGETEQALEWYRMAYEASTGRYSRFRWGSTYLRRLMALSPESRERIEAESITVLTELLSQQDAFAGGNHSRLGSLEAAYWSWNEGGAHEAEIDRIRSFVHASCDRFPAAAEDQQRERCLSFLTPQPVEGDAAV